MNPGRSMMAYADYLMVITPPENIIKEISRYKQASVNMIGHFEGMHRRPQIVIAHQTRCKPFLVQPAIERMAKRLGTMPEIELKINGFGFFDNSKTTKTIYVIVEIRDRTDKWFRLLTKQIGIKAKLIPHIAVASNIPVTSFNKLWPHFEQKALLESFMANSLTILTRDTYVEYCEWKVYRELFFANRLKEMF
jgi:hypothetical protein